MRTDFRWHRDPPEGRRAETIPLPTRRQGNAPPYTATAASLCDPVHRPASPRTIASLGLRGEPRDGASSAATVDAQPSGSYGGAQQKAADDRRVLHELTH